jgi:hypothetical protein
MATHPTLQPGPSLKMYPGHFLYAHSSKVTFLDRNTQIPGIFFNMVYSLKTLFNSMYPCVTFLKSTIHSSPVFGERFFSTNTSLLESEVYFPQKQNNQWLISALLA